jgi:hypothetical protein
MGDEVRTIMKLFKGKKYKFIHTQNIFLDDLRAVFFPKDFYEKYRYLGSVPYKEDTDLFNALLPLVLTMDYLAKPKWCPRWFLRFLHLFGSDNSVVRVRNWHLHNLHRKLTKGLFFVDYKLKWEWYDLRISIYGNKLLMDLADDIENRYYQRGRRKELLEELSKYPELRDEYKDWESLEKLNNLLNTKLEEEE